MIEIEEAETFIGNYRHGRPRPPDMVVIHTTEAPLESAVRWFGQDHKPFDKDPTSAHYVVGKGGRVVRCVDELHTAFHAGHFGYNLRSIGIECEGAAARRDTWTEPLLAALVELCAGICSRHAIPPDRRHFIGHAEVPDPIDKTAWGGVGHNVDPGTMFPWDRFIESLKSQLTNPGGGIV